MPSLRALMRQHAVSLSTTLQVCRLLESEGWLQARPRSGYFVQAPAGLRLAPVNDPPMQRAPDAAQYVGIHTKVSEFLALGRMQRFKLNLSTARCAPELYSGKRIAGAGLDVFDDEPRVPEALLSLDNVVLLAHIASGTFETRQAMADRVFDNLNGFLRPEI